VVKKGRFDLQENIPARYQWLTPVTLASWEAEIRRITV
jgi:hypothetical protein